MKKIFAKVGAIASAAALAVMSAPTIPVSAAEDYQGEVSLYIGFGGSGEAAGDWGLQYNSPDNDGNNADIVSTSATAKVGDTVTISLEFPEAVTHAYWVAPVVYTEGDETVFGSVDADVSLKIDGVEVEIDKNADAEGKLSWAEGTGDYANSWRLYGGTNEWATQYVAQDVFEGATSIEYIITINSITEGEAVKLGPAYEGDTTVYIGFGGDLSESGDWGMQYNSPDDGGNNTDIVASNATAKVGDTVTVSLEFPVAVSHAYWVAPVIVSSDDATEFGAVDATVTLFIDGKEVDIDASAGDAAWAEGTGQYVNSWRLYGGTNEWAAQYVPQEAFEGASKIEYTITINAIHETEGAPVSSAGPVDLSGTYNAYIGLQTPKYSFRNSWSESSYGLNGSEGSEYFERITSWTDDGSAYTTPGTITDAVIEGNGTYTVSVTGIEWPEGEFADQDYMNQIFISTDIPNTGEVTISNVVLTIDNTNVSLASAGAILSPDDVDYMTILIQNIWNSDVTTIGYYSVPFTDISITFDVAGFDYDKAAQDAPADEPPTNDEGTVTDQADDGAEAVETSSGKGLVVGIVVVVIAAAAIACGVVLKKRFSGKGDAK
jgi:hypothetical protein